MHPNLLHPREEAAALAVFFVKSLMCETEGDSNPDHWQVMKDKVARLERIAQAVIGTNTCFILDDSAYLIGELPEK
jgi:hypothetical protein